MGGASLLRINSDDHSVQNGKQAKRTQYFKTHFKKVEIFRIIGYTIHYKRLLTGENMTSHEIVKALTQIKTYVSVADLDAFDYAIKVFELLEEKQIKNPLEFIIEKSEDEK